MAAITFKASVTGLDVQTDEALITLPKLASSQLTSRSTVLVKGTINNRAFWAALEPDGEGSHWFTLNKKLREAARVKPGDTANLQIDPIPVKEWPEPKVPADLKKTLEADPKVYAIWTDITPMARWDWVRWVDTVKLAETRKERPEKVRSMLRAGKRRPCCFNRAARTPPKSAELL